MGNSNLKLKIKDKAKAVDAFYHLKSMCEKAGTNIIYVGSLIDFFNLYEIELSSYSNPLVRLEDLKEKIAPSQGDRNEPKGELEKQIVDKNIKKPVFLELDKKFQDMFKFLKEISEERAKMYKGMKEIEEYSADLYNIESKISRIISPKVNIEKVKPDLKGFSGFIEIIKNYLSSGSNIKYEYLSKKFHASLELNEKKLQKYLQNFYNKFLDNKKKLDELYNEDNIKKHVEKINGLLKNKASNEFVFYRLPYIGNISEFLREKNKITYDELFEFIKEKTSNDFKFHEDFYSEINTIYNKILEANEKVNYAVDLFKAIITYSSSFVEKVKSDSDMELSKYYTTDQESYYSQSPVEKKDIEKRSSYIINNNYEMEAAFEKLQDLFVEIDRLFDHIEGLYNDIFNVASDESFVGELSFSYSKYIQNKFNVIAEEKKTDESTIFSHIENIVDSQYINVLKFNDSLKRLISEIEDVNKKNFDYEGLNILMNGIKKITNTNLSYLRETNSIIRKQISEMIKGKIKDINSLWNEILNTYGIKETHEKILFVIVNSGYIKFMTLGGEYSKEQFLEKKEDINWGTDVMLKYDTLLNDFAEKYLNDIFKLKVKIDDYHINTSQQTYKSFFNATRSIPVGKYEFIDPSIFKESDVIYEKVLSMLNVESSFYKKINKLKSLNKSIYDLFSDKHVTEIDSILSKEGINITAFKAGVLKVYNSVKDKKNQNDEYHIPFIVSEVSSKFVLSNVYSLGLDKVTIPSENNEDVHQMDKLETRTLDELNESDYKIYYINLSIECLYQKYINELSDVLESLSSVSSQLKREIYPILKFLFGMASFPYSQETTSDKLGATDYDKKSKLINETIRYIERYYKPLFSQYFNLSDIKNIADKYLGGHNVISNSVDEIYKINKDIYFLNEINNETYANISYSDLEKAIASLSDKLNSIEEHKNNIEDFVKSFHIKSENKDNEVGDNGDGKQNKKVNIGGDYFLKSVVELSMRMLSYMIDYMKVALRLLLEIKKRKEKDSNPPRKESSKLGLFKKISEKILGSQYFADLDKSGNTLELVETNLGKKLLLKSKYNDIKKSVISINDVVKIKSIGLKGRVVSQLGDDVFRVYVDEYRIVDATKDDLKKLED